MRSYGHAFIMTHEWYLKRNCCLTPRQLALVYAFISVTTIAVAVMCVILHGAWQIMIFAVVELSGVAIAFLSYARHAADHERIALTKNCLLVERVRAGESVQIRLDPQWTRIAGPDRDRRLIELDACGVHAQVGQFVTEAGRYTLAQELRQALRLCLSAASA